MKFLTLAAKLVLTGAVTTTLAVAQAPQAYAHCGNPTIHAAWRELRALEADPRFASADAQAQLKAYEAQLRQAAQAWIAATRGQGATSGQRATSGLVVLQTTGVSTTALQAQINTIRDSIQQRARAQRPFG
jgi:hypothetical protein